MNELRDPVVGDALRRLDVPDHAPDFWARLDASLAHEASTPDLDDTVPADDTGEGTGDGAEVIELAAARSARPRAARRPGRIPAIAAAAAAAALALGVGLPAIQQAADGDAQVDLADRPDGSTTSDPSTSASTDPSTSAVVPATSTPAEVATEWLTALRDGRIEEAYALLDDTSQALLPLDEFRQVASGLGEGAGGFADLEPTTTGLMDDEGLAATAVVFTGDVQREAVIETASFAVILTGDPDDPSRPLEVAFTLQGPKVEAVQRTNPSETRTSPVEVDLSPTAGASWVMYDGVTLDRIDAREGTVFLDVEAAAGPGTHTVTVISTEGGLYTARSYTVVVP